MDSFVKYTEELKKALDGISVEKLKKLQEILHSVFVSEKQIFICGNGGSFANSQHIAEDMNKVIASKNIYYPRAIALCSNPAQITCLSNDYSYNDIFAFEVQTFCNSGDILIGISVSGTSQNVYRAFQIAKAEGIKTISITGNKNIEKPINIATIADLSIVIESSDFGIVEDCSIHIFHNLVREFCSHSIENFYGV